MEILLIAVGKLKNKALQQLCIDYQKRLKHYTKFEVKEVKDGKASDPEQKKSEEEILIRKNLDPRNPVWLLDEKGLAWNSFQLSHTLEKWEIEGVKQCQWVIGGAFGLSEGLKKRHPTLQLSSFTLTHEMARYLLIEQFYRAYTILRGHPYQK